MTDTIAEFVRTQPVIDVHEHHMPETLLSRDIGLVQLFEQSYAGWTRDRPYRLPSETGLPEPIPTRVGEGSWEQIAAYVEHAGSSAFVRNLVHAIAELYELGDEGITRDNWKAVDERIQQRHADPTWVGEVLDRAGIRRIITDPYTNPMQDARETLGERYQSVLRINALAIGWHPESRDHNGNGAADFAARLDLKIRSFDGYLDLLARLVDTLGERHQVALKNALAYDRAIDFDDVDEKLARKAWGKPRPARRQRKAFGDVVVDRLCRLAGERNVPVQMHLGSAVVRGSQPMSVAGLIERHPGTRFLLMHLAYPWKQDLFGLAFVYRNVWLDLTWSWLLSPSYFARGLHEAIEVLPDESRLMLGGDNWHAEETYGAITWARRLIAEALEEKVRAGYFRADDAKRLARKILHDNAAAFFGVNG